MLPSKYIFTIFNHRKELCKKILEYNSNYIDEPVELFKIKNVGINDISLIATFFIFGPVILVQLSKAKITVFD